MHAWTQRRGDEPPPADVEEEQGQSNEAQVEQRGDDVRIYSTWYLEAHEIVNDEFDGEALLVSW